MDFLSISAFIVVLAGLAWQFQRLRTQLRVARDLREMYRVLWQAELGQHVIAHLSHPASADALRAILEKHPYPTIAVDSLITGGVSVVNTPTATPVVPADFPFLSSESATGACCRRVPFTVQSVPAPITNKD